MSEYFDCTLQVGYYKLSGGPVGEHTFVVGNYNGERYAFPCFGGYALSEGEHGDSGVVYPAELWSPYIIGSTRQGNSLPANLYVALGMAQ